MFENTTLDNFLTLEELGLDSSSGQYPAFILGILMYTLILTFNSMVLLSIVASKKLYKPMFLLLCNLPISDMIGASAFFPHLIFSIITKNRIIPYNTCMFQAFLIHFYGTANLLTLSAMAYDRYIAICSPLRYNSIMTTQTLVKLIIMIWFINVAIMGTLFALHVRLTLCKTKIIDLYCNNPSLLKLACFSSDVMVINYYGMFHIALLQGGSLLVIMYTYVQILRLCVMSKQAEVRRKAAQTCSSHLVSYLFLQLNTIITLTAHRIPNASSFLRRSMGVSVVIFPPFLDPIIYGLSSQEIKSAFFVLIKRNVK
ncbi:olfactory receptor 4D1-like [Boleophthalmus pectinirostris]|uniref:olfactory receptor 4D1-like n=1 Tax=Boleophthalmus pectinirostris TaxID=150288 RepID=UPI000A1C44F7|nr:olfactory receptor 4D1-like [Boleophthalmus pectinirostris]